MCHRHDTAMARLERAVTEPVELLLRADWAPHEIVRFVSTGVSKSSRAPTLVKIALLACAVEWQGDSDRFTDLFRVRELGRRTGFRVETIRPGWFETWMWQGAGGLRRAQLHTRHVVEVLQPIVEFAELGVTAESTSRVQIGRPRRDELIRAYGREVPEAGDQRWTYRSDVH